MSVVYNLLVLPFIPNKIVNAESKNLSIDEKELDKCMNYITAEECAFSSTLNKILSGIELEVGDYVIYKDLTFKIHSICTDLIDSTKKEYLFQKVE